MSAVLRLRGSVRARQLADGIQVQGRHAAFTATGGADLWRLWERLEPHLRHGVGADALDPVAAPAGTRRVLRDLLQALRDHDLVLSGRAGWWLPEQQPPSDDVVDWLEDAAPDPVAGWHRLRGTAVRVQGPPRLAEPATAALSAAGIPTESATGALPGVLLRLTSADGDAVVAGTGPAGGFVTPPGLPGRVDALADRIARRVDVPRAGSGDAATAVPAQLVDAVLAAAAAHRLACRVAGMPDPAQPRVPAARRRDGRPRVLLVRADPWAVEYRAWPVPEPAAAGDGTAETGPPLPVAERVGVLCDPVFGAVPVPETARWPQLPAGLAIVTLPDGTVLLGTGASTGAARVDVALRAVERRLDPALTGRLAAGADQLHADGVLLRRVARERLLDGVRWQPWRPGDPVTERWWTALTRRFAVPAHCRVARLAPTAVAARVDLPGRAMITAVEVTVRDAAAFALLQAVAVEQAHRAGLPPDPGPPTLCGVGAVAASSDGEPDGEPDGERAGDRPAGRAAERTLQQALLVRLPDRFRPRDAAARSGHLGDVLRAVDVAVREVG